MINKANLKKRLMFAAVAVPVAFFIVTSTFNIAAFALNLFGMDANTIPPIYFGQLLAIIIVMFGTYEYIKMLNTVNRHNGFWLGYIWVLILSFTYLFDYNIPTAVSNIAFLIIVVFEAFAFGKDEPQGRWKRACLFFCGILFLSIASVGMLSLYRAPFQTLFNAPAIAMLGKFEVIMVLTAVFMCDTAAYFAGSTIGKRRLSSISPNKTIEGSLAGLATATLITAVSFVFFRNPEYPVFIGIIMGVLIGVASQVGDLLASLIKRYFNVKDTSAIIPGHGGILDRFDSLFFAAPALYLFAWLLTR